MQRLSCQAIVLDLRDYGEADLIVSLSSPKLGKIQTIAKSARKSKRRFVNKLEFFTLLNATLRPSRAGLPLLEEAELLRSFLRLRQNAALYATASLIREFLLAAAHEGDGDPEMFALSLWTLDSLSKNSIHNNGQAVTAGGSLNQHCRAVAAQFLVRYFDHIGYRPELECCQKCGQAMAAGGPGITRPWQFSAARGGLICPACASKYAPVNGARGGSLSAAPNERLGGRFNGRFDGPPAGQTIQPGTAKLLSFCLSAPLSHLQRLKIAAAPLDEALRLLWRYGNVVLGREIVSWRLFQQLTENQSI